MTAAADEFWARRLEHCAESLRANGFEVHLAADPQEAKRIILEEIVPALGARTVSWGDSMTLIATGVLDVFRADPRLEFIETFDPDLGYEEKYERRRQALLVDLFLSGTNAVTLGGQLVNLDMVGNRVGGITFGPKHVVLTLGRNKIVRHLGEAVQRIKQYAAPANALRHHFNTPCTKEGTCLDCRSPKRICNVWTIIEKSFPPGRIKVVLIDRDLGL